MPGCRLTVQSMWLAEHHGITQHVLRSDCHTVSGHPWHNYIHCFYRGLMWCNLRLITSGNDHTAVKSHVGPNVNYCIVYYSLQPVHELLATASEETVAVIQPRNDHTMYFSHIWTLFSMWRQMTSKTCGDWACWMQGSHYISVVKFKDFQGPWSCIFKDQLSTEVHSMYNI